MHVADSPVTHEMPQLPETWVPDDAVIFGIGRHHVEDGVWEVVLPHYTIVGRGASFDEAVHQASEELEDYFRLMARSGVPFDDAGRPIGTRWLARILAEAAVAAASRRINRTRARMRILRFPARHAFC